MCKKFEDHISYYSAVGNIPHSILREIAAKSGVHIYFERDDPIYINSRLIGIHAVQGGEVTFNLPFDASVEELFDGGRFISKNKKIAINIKKGEMKMYFVTYN